MSHPIFHTDSKKHRPYANVYPIQIGYRETGFKIQKSIVCIPTSRDLREAPLHGIKKPRYARAGLSSTCISYPLVYNLLIQLHFFKLRDPIFTFQGQFVISVIAMLNPLAFDDIFAILNHPFFNAL